MIIMTIKEVCDYLKIKRTSFYNYKAMGMPVHKVPGRKPFCYKEEIDQWLSQKGQAYDGISTSV